MMPVTFPNRNEPLNILCLGAHCDDIEIGCGGTVLRLLEQHPDIRVQWTVFSSNRVRAEEFLKSSHCFLGDKNAEGSRVHEFHDGFFPHSWKEIKENFEQIKMEMAPDIIFTHYKDDLHQDHRIISELTWNTFRNNLILEYEIPKYDGDLKSPNLFFPLTDTICEKKTQLIIANYLSQTEKSWFTKETFMATLRIRGMEANSPTKFAEGFYCRKIVF